MEYVAEVAPGGSTQSNRMTTTSHTLPPTLMCVRLKRTQLKVLKVTRTCLKGELGIIHALPFIFQISQNSTNSFAECKFRKVIDEGAVYTGVAKDEKCVGKSTDITEDGPANSISNNVRFDFTRGLSDGARTSGVGDRSKSMQYQTVYDSFHHIFTAFHHAPSKKMGNQKKISENSYN